MISIIVSVYNSDKTLSQMIQSVLNQSYTNFEFILINDGSSDNSLTIMNQHANKDKRIVIIDKENSGLTKSLNIGLNKAQGKYIARIDADDIWKENKLEKQIEFLGNNKDCVLVGTAYDEIDEFGNIIYDIQRTPLLISNDEIVINITKFNPFLHSSVLFRKEVILKVGLYNEKFKYTQDYEYWVRIISKYKVANLNDVLVSRRYSENMISLTKEKEQRMFAIKSKALAIKLLNKSIFEYKYLMNDILVFILPSKLTNIIRKVIRSE